MKKVTTTDSDEGWRGREAGNYIHSKRDGDDAASANLPPQQGWVGVESEGLKAPGQPGCNGHSFCYTDTHNISQAGRKTTTACAMARQRAAALLAGLAASARACRTTFSTLRGTLLQNFIFPGHLTRTLHEMQLARRRLDEEAVHSEGQCFESLEAERTVHSACTVGYTWPSTSCSGCGACGRAASAPPRAGTPTTPLPPTLSPAPTFPLSLPPARSSTTTLPFLLQ